MSTTTKKKVKSEIPSTLHCSSCGAEAQILTPLDDPEHFAEQLDAWNDEHENCRESDSARRVMELAKRYNRPLYESEDAVEKRWRHRRPSWASEFNRYSNSTSGQLWEYEFRWQSREVILPAVHAAGQTRSSDGFFGAAERRVRLSQRILDQPRIVVSLRCYADRGEGAGEWVSRVQSFSLDEARQFVEVFNELIEIGEAG